MIRCPKPGWAPCYWENSTVFYIIPKLLHLWVSLGVYYIKSQRPPSLCLSPRARALGSVAALMREARSWMVGSSGRHRQDGLWQGGLCSLCAHHLSPDPRREANTEVHLCKLNSFPQQCCDQSEACWNLHFSLTPYSSVAFLSRGQTCSTKGPDNKHF